MNNITMKSYAAKVINGIFVVEYENRWMWGLWVAIATKYGIGGGGEKGLDDGWEEKTQIKLPTHCETTRFNWFRWWHCCQNIAVWKTKKLQETHIHNVALYMTFDKYWCYTRLVQVCAKTILVFINVNHNNFCYHFVHIQWLVVHWYNQCIV